MASQIVENFKARYEKLGDRTNEENIKFRVIADGLVNDLGYDFDSFDYEHPMYHNTGRADIAVQVNKNDYLYIETKRGTHKISEIDIIQLAEYMNQKSIEWGLLTNGREFLLLNNKIETLTGDINKGTTLVDKIVFHIDIFSNRETKFFEYLSKEAIFDSRVTHYFKDVAQFRAFKYPRGTGSWGTYKSTLYGFFTYYANKEKKYRDLEEIRVDEFESFLKDEKRFKENTGKSVNSQETFNNKYSHIRSMFSELKKRKKIRSHHFEEERRKLIENLPYSNTGKDENHLTYENVEIAINYLSSLEKPTRGLIIFMMSVYAGLERSQIMNLTWNMFDKQRRWLKIDGREIPLPNKITTLLNELEKENRENKIKGNFLFYTFYKQKYNRITESSINAVFDRLSKIDENDQKWTYFSPQYVRNNLVVRLYLNGYSIEEIVYITGMDLVNISGILSYDVICSQVDLARKDKVKSHPFSKLLN
ncbi:type I restriction enzyme HsdR N-terminal domain-containing protein [Paenibacillus validus]|uniref:Tyrosine-type recombinase/integrase n=1 Tax=Paenibacillus validus TaxID=44253 RepID=A0A7X3CUI5_9BACL|nr:type I restriction enzyme HsdR N-terminal domain-containing protein [Paenibacillus validus]MUG72177.1 tyrosine-type recombinase/integrase [Paenibacillus validus]